MCACRYFLKFTSMHVKNMQVCKYESIKVPKYLSVLVCTLPLMQDTSIQEYKYTSMYFFKYAHRSIQTCKYEDACMQ